MIYVYFYESIFQDKSIHIIFTFSNLTTWELFMIYIPKVWLKPCPKRLPLQVRREYTQLIAGHKGRPIGQVEALIYTMLANHRFPRQSQSKQSPVRVLDSPYRYRAQQAESWASGGGLTPKTPISQDWEERPDVKHGCAMPDGRWSQAPWRPKTGKRQEVCTLAQSSIAYFFLLLHWKVGEFIPTHLSGDPFLHVLLVDRFCYNENIYLVLFS